MLIDTLGWEQLRPRWAAASFRSSACCQPGSRLSSGVGVYGGTAKWMVYNGKSSSKINGLIWYSTSILGSWNSHWKNWWFWGYPHDSAETVPANSMGNRESSANIGAFTGLMLMTWRVMSWFCPKSLDLYVRQLENFIGWLNRCLLHYATLQNLRCFKTCSLTCTTLFVWSPVPGEGREAAVTRSVFFTKTFQRFPIISITVVNIILDIDDWTINYSQKHRICVVSRHFSTIIGMVEMTSIFLGWF